MFGIYWKFQEIFFQLITTSLLEIAMVWPDFTVDQFWIICGKRKELKTKKKLIKSFFQIIFEKIPLLTGIVLYFVFDCFLYTRSNIQIIC